ncbi:hypothetical protein BT69DRAFT_1347562 [Atractiella rhizophila]|nr:hypothetical protein BT69DRAFT_1347562 [Atractiella rhizophila]
MLKAIVPLAVAVATATAAVTDCETKIVSLRVPGQQDDTSPWSGRVQYLGTGCYGLTMRFFYGSQQQCTLYEGQESFTTPQRNSEVDFSCPTVPANSVNFNSHVYWWSTGTAENGTEVYNFLTITQPRSPWFLNNGE